ncbi:MAG: PilZ domain-containing protein [Deltaproteobacteria bacterium]|nr:PilZ domain-containing protein [Deltaproteobacteria bacterium]
MTTQEKRKHYRVDSLNLLSYTCLDEEGNFVKHGMGRTLNVSESGLLLETHIELEPQHAILLTIGLEEDLVEIRAQVMHSKMGPEGKVESGIHFFEMDEPAKVVLTKYIKAFEAQQ